MNTDSLKSKAVEIAIQHVEAFSTHDYATARSLLADDVHFILVTSVPGFPNPSEGHGVEEFMKALTSGNTLIPGSLQVIHSIGDDHQALITVSVKGTLPTHEPVTLPDQLKKKGPTMPDIVRELTIAAAPQRVWDAPPAARRNRSLVDQRSECHPGGGLSC